MNTKQVSLVVSILVSGLGCSTLPRPQLSHAGDSGRQRVAVANGPALIHISTAGSGTAKLYLADDPGDGSATCPTQKAEGVVPFKALEDDDYAGDVPVPKGKRVCAELDSPQLTVDWLAEDYSAPASTAQPAPTLTPPASDSRGVLMAKK
jgi:hypothetical protein